MATFVAGILIAYLFIYYGGPFGARRLVPLVLNLTATVGGIFLCYSVNRNRDDNDFITRMICLGWPAGIRLIAGFSAFFLLLVLVPTVPFDEEPKILEKFGRVLPDLGFFLIYLYFWHIRIYLPRCSLGMGFEVKMKEENGKLVADLDRTWEQQESRYKNYCKRLQSYVKSGKRFPELPPHILETIVFSAGLARYCNRQRELDLTISQAKSMLDSDPFKIFEEQISAIVPGELLRRPPIFSLAEIRSAEAAVELGE